MPQPLEETNTNGGPNRRGGTPLMFAVINTETTHIAPGWERIIEIAVIHLNDDG